MDSRTREAYESGYSRGHNDTVESRVVSIELAAEEYMDTCLTAEPKPPSTDDVRSDLAAIERLTWAPYYSRVMVRDIASHALGILQGSEPAKVSEDVERDIDTVRADLADVAAAPTSMAQAAFERLISLIMEGNRG